MIHNAFWGLSRLREIKEGRVGGGGGHNTRNRWGLP